MNDAGLVVFVHIVFAIGFIIGALLAYQILNSVLLGWFFILIGIFYFNFTLLLENVVLKEG